MAGEGTEEAGTGGLQTVSDYHPSFWAPREALVYFLFPLCHLFCKSCGYRLEETGYMDHAFSQPSDGRAEGKDYYPDNPWGAHSLAGEKSRARQVLTGSNTRGVQGGR